jgi:AbrB family looped-hinge helix DNA binding protein
LKRWPKSCEGANHILKITKITSKGQVTIPADIRENMGLTPGTDVVFMEVDDMVILKKSEDSYYQFFVLYLEDIAKIYEIPQIENEDLAEVTYL